MGNIITPLIIFFLALAPACVWFYVFNKENPERVSSSIFALIAGGLSTIPVLFYQKLWGYEGNFIFFKLTPVNFQDNIISLFGFSSFNSASQIASGDYMSIAILALFSAFIGVGFLEEIFKHVVINPRFVYVLALLTIGALFYQLFMVEFEFISLVYILFYLVFLYFMPKVIRFSSIDDAISLAVIAAIGFSFVENIIYFWYKWETISSSMGVSSIFSIGFSEFMQFLGFVFIRVSVVTMIHVLCSGVFGYHFGLAHFAAPELIHDMRNGRDHKLVQKFHEILHIPEDKIFMVEQLIKALFLSILLHGIYDLVVQINVSVFGFPLIVIIMPLYFFGGFVYLFSLIEDVDNKRDIGVLKLKEEYVKER